MMLHVRGECYGRRVKVEQQRGPSGALGLAVTAILSGQVMIYFIEKVTREQNLDVCVRSTLSTGDSSCRRSKEECDLFVAE